MRREAKEASAADGNASRGNEEAGTLAALGKRREQGSGSEEEMRKGSEGT